MKKSWFLLTVLAATLAMGSTAFADVRAGAITITPFLGGYTFDGVQSVQTNVVTGLKVGYNITPHWGVEGQFSYVPLRSTNAAFPNSGEQYGVRADVLYHFLPEGILSPFVALGGGWSKVDHIVDNQDAVLAYGGGFKYAVNKWIAVRADVRHIFSFHLERQGSFWSNLEYTGGLTFQLDGCR
jgi:OOP family OmpA-OmpF porin